MKLFKVIYRILVFCLLTLLTQIGGIVYLLSLVIQKFIDKWTKRKFIRYTISVASFLILYCATTFFLVPVIAKPLGRVPLPLTTTNNLQPLNILTCLLNRNYVKQELRQTAFNVAIEMQNRFPGTIVNYLDAGFPFINHYPLLPHLSHNDGKKLDLSFCYIESKTKKATNSCPSFIGYGICEEPFADEVNTASYCTGKGGWQYNFLRRIVPQGNKEQYIFDGVRTKELVNLFADQTNIGKIFIEPHLKMRLRLYSEKIRFQGCQAVRHDDHIHIQLK
jgi:hypothetical protein